MEPIKLAKATLVTAGVFGANVVHIRDVEITIKPWAQYPRVLSISYVEKGARKRKGSVFYNHDSMPFLFEGWHNVPIRDAFEKQEDGTSISRLSSFSPEIGRETREACERFKVAHPGVQVFDGRELLTRKAR